MIITVLVCSVYQAQDIPHTYYESSYGKLEYGFYVPENYDYTKKYPLLMYLHGWGNNYTVYLEWYDSEFQAENPCFILTPKTPTTWADWSGWWDQLTEPMTAALHVMDSLLNVYSIDTNRLYVYGISMGGEGTFDLLHKFPNKFAAAMSVCGGGQPFWAENISKTPFWMFHGSADNINPPNLTEQVYNELVNMGAKKMRYKKYLGYGHEIWNVAASEPSWNDWMFAHSRNDTAFLKPTLPIELEGVVSENGNISLKWNDVRNPEEKGNKIWYYKIYNSNALIGTTEFNKTSYVFSPTNEIDTFYVRAVNYHFKESDSSNIVCYYEGSLITGIKELDQEKIYKTIIYQNYPNPFNPVTTIKYIIPSEVKSDASTSSATLAKVKNIRLVVYDVLGREVVTLVNEKQKPGNYEVEFDASNLPSGIYIYRLITANYTKTIKTVYIK